MKQTLEELLHSRVTEYAASDKPAEIIDAHVNKMFNSIIEDVFRSYGDAGKLIKNAIEKALPGNLDEAFELERYNSLIVKTLTKHWESSGIEGTVVKRATEAMDTAVAELTIPEFVSLKELLNKFVESHQDSAYEEGWEVPDIRFEESDNSYQSIHLRVYFAQEPKGDVSIYSSRNKSIHQLDNCLTVLLRDDDVNEAGHKFGEVYAGKLDGDVIGSKITPYYSDYEKLIVGLYYGKSKLIFDCDEDDFSYKSHYD